MDDQDTPEAPEWWKWVLWAWHHARINRADFMKAPIVAALIACVAAGYWLRGHEDTDRLDLATQSVGVSAQLDGLLREQVAEYKDKYLEVAPHGDSPGDAKLVKQIDALQEKLKTLLTQEPVRTISNASKDKLKTLKLGASTIARQGMVLVYSSSDENSSRYASDLISALRSAGLDPLYGGMGIQGVGETGIILYVINPDRPSDAAKLLISALSDSKIPFKIERWVDRSNFPDVPDFVLFVTREKPAPA